MFLWLYIFIADWNANNDTCPGLGTIGRGRMASRDLHVPYEFPYHNYVELVVKFD